MPRDSSDMRFLPVAINVQGQHCIVVGGGSVGTRKAQTLARAGASVTVISPTVGRELAVQIDADRVRWLNDTYREEHLEGAFLVVAATNDEALNASIAQRAAERGVLVCDASSAERSQVIFGALLREGDATIAVFTDGRDPAHARRKRDQIAGLMNRENKSEPP